MAETLKDRLIERIRREGPLTFAAFMEAALYDPADGFYARRGDREPVGEEGHFVTSPHVSPAFGDLLARQLAEAWDLLGKPERYSVVELGAGDGTLALQVRAAVRVVSDLARALRYVGVERTSSAIDRLRARGVDIAPSLDDVGPITGCIVANELLDNLPFHRLRERRGRTVEVLVGARDGRLIEVEAEPTGEALTAIREPLRPGEELPVSPEALEMVRAIASALEGGYAFLFDYGFGAGETPGPVHAYRDHEVLANVLDDPGSRDVTAAVDLAAVAAEAKRAGLQVWGPVPQREALLGLGFQTWMQGIRNRQREAEAAGDWRAANRLFAERSKASILVDEGKLGGLRLLVLGTRGLPAPTSAIGDRDAGC
ncbi:MAG TPA: SAM-dependent methyltransferase [Actinomycetota bacterium]|nr:SAM-dependent methyltransferase [Actinomycetota bacterium]